MQTNCANMSSTNEDPDVNMANRKILCGMVAEIDDGVKSIRLQLEKLEEWDQTLLLVMSDNGGIVIDDTGAISKRREILRGGSTIGYLERAALIGAVIAGQAAAAALIVAVKGLGRFSELDDSMARERFIIGTLTSLIWAGACAAAIMLVV